MHSEYFVLNKTTTNNRSLKKSMLLAGSLVVVGTVATIMVLQNTPIKPQREIVLYGEDQYSEHQVAFMQFLA
jgi:hypothetical protein